MVLDLCACSVLSGYGRDSLDNELDMDLDDDVDAQDGFTEDRFVGVFYSQKCEVLYFGVTLLGNLCFSMLQVLQSSLCVNMEQLGSSSSFHF